MSVIWTLIIAVSVLYGAYSGRLGELSAAVIEGAGDAVTVTLSLAGALCLWSGVTEAISRAGGIKLLSRAASPLLRLLFKQSSGDREITDAVSANMAANLLGLGNAATPPGIRAASLMSRRAPRDMCTLVVINTASIQLIPATAAALRSSLGASAPFDIIPAVWCSSLAALLCGIAALAVLRRIFERRGG